MEITVTSKILALLCQMETLLCHFFAGFGVAEEGGGVVEVDEVNAGIEAGAGGVSGEEVHGLADKGVRHLADAAAG